MFPRIFCEFSANFPLSLVRLDPMPLPFPAGIRLLCAAVLGLACVAGLSARAAAPVEERTHRTDPLEDAQQRVEYVRRQAEAAEAQVQQAERALREAEAALAPAQKQADDARARRDQAKGRLAAARAKAAEIRKAHAREAAAFDQLRRADAQRAAKK